MISVSKIKNWLRRLKFKLNHDFFTIENVVLGLAIILCLVWTFQSIKAMSRNWELSEKLTAEKKTLELLKVEVEAAELENDYYKSDEYQELLARKQLDKKLEGENMVVLPENSEAAKNKYKNSSVEVVEKKYSNAQKWMMYLFPNY